MGPEKDLHSLLKNMTPVKQAGVYVFVSVPDDFQIPFNEIIASFREDEGLSLILSKEKADSLGLEYYFEACWISLTVHSSLEAVGLTAAISSELTKHNIPCNVVAGYHHDHLFVPVKHAGHTIEILNALGTS